MAKTRLEKIASYEEKITQIKNRQKLEKQKHGKELRAARTRRLCSRHGLLESMMPEIIDITEEQYKTFLERAVANNYGRDILHKIMVQGEKNGTAKAPTGATPITASNIAKPTATHHNDNIQPSGNVVGGATV
jgi:hypothetical protein